MTDETLNKGNDLRDKIRACKAVLASFAWEPMFDGDISYTRHPQLIIESDDGDESREQFKVPGEVAPDMLTHIRDYATSLLNQYQTEFDNLIVEQVNIKLNESNE